MFRGISKTNLPGYVSFFQFLRNFHRLTAFEQAEMILYAALDPAVAGKARKGEFVRCLDHFACPEKLGVPAGRRARGDVHAIDTYGPLDGLTADEALIIHFGRELLEAPQVSDATVNAVRTRYGEQGLLELTAVMSVYPTFRTEALIVVNFYR